MANTSGAVRSQWHHQHRLFGRENTRLRMETRWYIFWWQKNQRNSKGVGTYISARVIIGVGRATELKCRTALPANLFPISPTLKLSLGLVSNWILRSPCVRQDPTPLRHQSPRTAYASCTACSPPAMAKGHESRTRRPYSPPKKQGNPEFQCPVTTASIIGPFRPQEARQGGARNVRGNGNTNPHLLAAVVSTAKSLINMRFPSAHKSCLLLCGFHCCLI